MSGFDDMVRQASAGPGEIASTLRSQLMAQPREWLVDQLLATVAPQSTPHRPRPVDLDTTTLAEHTAHLGAWDSGECLATPPPPGLMISPAQRTTTGEDLLSHAKDLLYALLFSPTLTPIRRDRLTLTLPDRKAAVFGFLRGAVTETPADHGHTALLIEYPEVSSSLVGDAVVAALRVVNGLELNEEVLYARRTDVDS
ncbi:hypothetical protein [Actinokineospora inagensis]|uniref:hypothetical protein n=1 Tax=Actinokineospora inagensis TaxID=103730 RepID=UPI0003FB08C6|nr:hypothetical protein [Actinokineospora inagensis]